MRTLVNTHHHGDHTHGNWLFRPDATIIGHTRCREAMIAEGGPSPALFPEVAWGRIEVAPPDLTFDDRLDLWVDDLRVELTFVGPAHTTNDVVAWIPERGVLFAGDLLFNEGTPFVLAGSIAGALEACERLRAIGAKTIVPGHGAVCGPEVIDDVETYLHFVQDAAARGFAAGAEPLEVARGLDLGRFGAGHDGERLAANVHRAYSEMRGEPRATPLGREAVTDMITYNGGPPRCIA